MMAEVMAPNADVASSIATAMANNFYNKPRVFVTGATPV
jgi:hypothetical protein